ncbi:MAG: methyltransferase domain-containing protein [Chthoniobacter sp.]
MAGRVYVCGIGSRCLYQGKVLIDVGCGSRPVLDYFQQGQKFFLDPLLADYVKIPAMETHWQRHPASHRFCLPAEESVTDLYDRGDFVLCWNVINHSWDPFRIVEQIRSYAKSGAKILLGTDLCERPYLGHPGIKSKPEFLRLIEQHFRVVKRSTRNAFPTCLDIALLLQKP